MKRESQTLTPRKNSAASVSACVALSILAWLREAATPYFVVALLMSIVAFVKHIPNLKRIRVGIELRVGVKKGLN